MQKLYIVITKDGFLTSKKENNVLNSDEVIVEARNEKDAEELIHGGRKC